MDGLRIKKWFSSMVPLLVTVLITIFAVLCRESDVCADEAQGQGYGPKKKAPPLAPSRPHWEVSLMGSFSRSDYGNGSYSKNRRYSGSISYYLTTTTEIEASYNDARSFYNYEPSPHQTTDTWDRSLSLSVIQSLVPGNAILQPYLKGGGAQINRVESSTYNGVHQPDSTLKQPSAVLGAGVRISILHPLSIKFELTTFMPNFHISALKDNYDWEAGISFSF